MRRCGGSFLVGLGLCGCYSSTVTRQTTESPATQTRSRLAPDGPVLSGAWKLNGRTLSGRLTVELCAVDASWTLTDRDVTVYKSNQTVSAALAVSGGVLGLAGAALLNRKGEEVCSTRRTQNGEIMTWITECHEDTPDNTVPFLMTMVGLTVSTVGMVTLWYDRDPKVEVVGTRPAHARRRAPCLAPSDLQNLDLAMTDGSKVVPFGVRANGRATLTVPKNVELVPGHEWRIVVRRVPSQATSFLRVGEPLGQVTVQGPELKHAAPAQAPVSSPGEESGPDR